MCLNQWPLAFLEEIWAYLEDKSWIKTNYVVTEYLMKGNGLKGYYSFISWLKSWVFDNIKKVWCKFNNFKWSSIFGHSTSRLKAQVHRLLEMTYLMLESKNYTDRCSILTFCSSAAEKLCQQDLLNKLKYLYIITY